MNGLYAEFLSGISFCLLSGLQLVQDISTLACDWSVRQVWPSMISIKVCTHIALQGSIISYKDFHFLRLGKDLHQICPKYFLLKTIHHNYKPRAKRLLQTEFEFQIWKLAPSQGITSPVSNICMS